MQAPSTRESASSDVASAPTHKGLIRATMATPLVAGLLLSLSMLLGDSEVPDDAMFGPGFAALFVFAFFAVPGTAAAVIAGLVALVTMKDRAWVGLAAVSGGAVFAIKPYAETVRYGETFTHDDVGLPMMVAVVSGIPMILLPTVLLWLAWLRNR